MLPVCLRSRTGKIATLVTKNNNIQQVTQNPVLFRVFINGPPNQLSLYFQLKIKRLTLVKNRLFNRYLSASNA